MNMYSKRKGLRRICAGVLDLLFPPKCIGCGVCMRAFTQHSAVLCEKCLTIWEGAHLPTDEMVCQDASESVVLPPISLVAYHSHHTQGIPEKVIFHIKHRDDGKVFYFVAAELASSVQAVLDSRGESCRDLLITYPPRRFRAKQEDGFDQAQRLADALAVQMGGRQICLLERSKQGRHMAAQKKQNAKERAEKAKVAYRLKEKNASLVKGRMILLVDDVYTTGATLNSCAELLLGAGAALVMQVTVAKTVRM